MFARKTRKTKLRAVTEQRSREIRATTQQQQFREQNITQQLLHPRPALSGQRQPNKHLSSFSTETYQPMYVHTQTAFFFSLNAVGSGRGETYRTRTLHGTQPDRHTELHARTQVYIRHSSFVQLEKQNRPNPQRTTPRPKQTQSRTGTPNRSSCQKTRTPPAHNRGGPAGWATIRDMPRRRSRSPA